MKVAVIPASTQTGRATIKTLLDNASASSVVGIYRDLAKAPADFKSNSRFKAASGDVADSSSLDFSGVDVVVVVTPPQYTENDPVSRARLFAQNIKQAIAKAASVKRIVYISSAGAQHENGTGEIKTNYVTERELQDAAPEIVFIRCAYFMENWASQLETLKGDSPFFRSVASPASLAFPQVSVSDIGKAAAARAVQPSPLEVDPCIIDLHGPHEYSALDVQKAFEEVLGTEVQLRVVEPDQLENYYGHVLPPAVAELFTEMTKSFLAGGILYTDPLDPASEVQKGSVTLVDAFRKMVGK